MRNLILSLLVVAICCTCVSAQTFGARVGVNATNASIDISDVDIDTDGQINLMLGAFVDLPLGTNIVSVQPEINYLNRGYSSTFNGVEAEQTISYLDLGALLKVNFNRDGPLGFYAGVGPYLSYAIDGKQSIAGVERDLDFDGDRVKRGGIQFTGIGGVTFGSDLKFFAEVRYNGSLYNLSDDDRTDVRQNSIGLSGGIMVPLGN